MARTNFILAGLSAIACFVSACAPSPLYIRPTSGTVGEIPRDGRGEPLWGAIRPAPLAPGVSPMPVTGGIPIIPPPGVPPHP
jgi:hypothetical protein